MSYTVTVITPTMELITPWQNWLKATGWFDAEGVRRFSLTEDLKTINATAVSGVNAIEFVTEADAVMWMLKYS